MQLPLCVALAFAVFLPVPRALAQDDELPPWLREDPLDSELAGESEQSNDPARFLVTLGAGVSLRLVANEYYQQQAFAPGYIDLMAGMVLPGRGSVRHVVGLGVGINTTGDGGLSVGVDPFSQLVVAPMYGIRLGYDAPVPDWTLLLKISFPVTVTPNTNPGIELGAQGAYMFTAGFGAYAEAAVSYYMGGPGRTIDYTFHPIISVEAGLIIEYELLP